MLATAETERMAAVFAAPSPLALGLVEYRKLTTLLGITRPTLDRIARDPAENFPKRRKLGAIYYIRLGDLERWVNQRYGGE